jgi:O-antigen/teichoic acid export membrane protein
MRSFLQLFLKPNLSFKKYLLFAFLSTFASFIKYFLYAKFFGEEIFSYYSSVELFSAYALYFGTLGVFDGVSLLIPALKSKSDYNQKNLIIQESLTFIIIVTLILNSIVGFFTFFYLNFNMVLIILVISYISLSNLYNYGLMIINSHSNSVDFVKLTFIKNIFSISISLYVGLSTNLYGLLISEASVLFFILLYISLFKKYFSLFKLSLNLNNAIITCKLGFPLLINNILNNGSRNIERFLIISIGGIVLFGNYSFASIVIAVALSIQGILLQYLMPRISTYKNNIDILLTYVKYIDQLIFVIAALMIIFYPVFLFIISFISDNLISGFSSGFSVMKYLYFGMLAQFFYLYQSFFFVLKNTKILNFITLLSLIVSILISFILLYNGFTIEIVAISIVINRLLFGIIIRFLLHHTYIIKFNTKEII